MHISRVELENFKRHPSASFVFKPGVNAICGPNGAGKSSIVEAIGLALFDVHPYRRTSDLIRRGSRRARIVVEFVAAADHETYQAERILTETSSVWKLYRAEPRELLAERNESVADALRDLMDVERDADLKRLFSEILGVPQGSFTQAFLASDTERLKIFEPLLQVEEYRKASEKMRPLWLNALKTHQSGLQSRTEEIQRQLSVLPSKQEARQSLLSEIALIHERLTLLHAELPPEKARLSALHEEASSLKTLQAESQGKEESRRQLTKDVEELQREEAKAKEAASIVAKTQADHALHQKIDPVLAQKRAIETSLKAAKTRQDAIVVERAKATDARRSAEEEFQRLAKKADELALLAPHVSEQERLEAEEKRLRQKADTRRNLETTQTSEKLELLKIETELVETGRLFEEWKRCRPLKEESEALIAEGKERKEEQKLLQDKQKERQREEDTLRKMQEEATKKRLQLEQTEAHLRRLTETFGPKAASLEDTEARWSTAKEEYAALESRLRQEKTFHAQAQGGICPIFQDRCRNLPEGQGLDGFLSQTLQEIETKLPSLQTLISKLKRAYDDAKDSQKKLDSEGKRLEIEVGLLRDDLLRGEASLAAQEALVASLPDHTEAIASLEGKLQQMRLRLSEIKADAKKFDELQRVGVEFRFGQLESAILSKRALLSERQAAFQTLAEEIACLPGLESAIAALHDPRQKAYLLQEDLKRKPACEAQIAKALAKLAALDAEDAALPEGLQGYASLQAEIAELQATFERTKAAHALYLSHQKGATELPSIQEKLASKEALRTEATELCHALQNKIAPLKRSLEGLDLAALKQTFEARSEEATRLEARLPEKLQEAERLRQEIQALFDEEARLATIRVEIRDFEKMQKCSDFFRYLYNTVAPLIAQRLVAAISIEAARLYRHLMMRPSMRLRWKHDGSDKFAIVLLEEDGSERDFKSLSGGEQMAAALAVRLALIKELSKIRIAFFDEPTAHMDEIRRKQLAASIREIKGFDQIFVISHDDTFESMIDHIVWLDREDL